MPTIGMNRVLLIGEVASTPRYKITPAQQIPRLWLRVRTDETYRDKAGLEKVRRAYHSVVVWGNLAKALNEFLREGHHVAVDGRLTTRQYELDGAKRYETEIVAQSLVTLTPKGVRLDAA